MNTEDFEELMFLWEEYGKESIDKLTEDAKLLRYKTIKFIESLPDLPGALCNPPKVSCSSFSEQRKEPTK